MKPRKRKVGWIAIIIGICLILPLAMAYACGWALHDVIVGWLENRRMTRQDAILVLLREAWPGGLTGREIEERAAARHQKDPSFPAMSSTMYVDLERLSREGWVRSEQQDQLVHGLPRLIFFLASGRSRSHRGGQPSWAASLEQPLPDGAAGQQA